MTNNKIEENFLEKIKYTFLEYFYIFGINSEIIFSNILYNQNTIEEKNKQIKPVLISKFPPFNKSTNINENIILQNCFSDFNLIEYICPKNEIFHFSLNNNLENNEKIYFTCLLFYEPLSLYYECKKYHNSLNNSNLKNEENMLKGNSLNSIFIPKIICLSSLYPFPEEKSKILKGLLRYVFSCDNITFPIEKIIENLMLEIPLPPKGLYKIKYKNNFLFQDDIIFKLNPLNNLQVHSYKMQYIFSFSLGSIIEIIKYIILEIPILFFCKNKEKLTNVVHTFLSLIYPLKYQFFCISILPKINYALIENVKCFIFGINLQYNKNFFFEYNIDIGNKKILICDIDSGKIQKLFSKENLYQKFILNDIKIKQKNTIKNKENNEINVQLPSQETNKLKSRLEDLLKNNKLKINPNSDEYNEDICFEISDSFFFYFVSILSFYNDYLFNDEKEIKEICLKIKKNNYNLSDIWKDKEFFDKCKIEEKDFYELLFQTKIFQNLIIRKYYHNEQEENLNLLLFDEVIVLKKNKKSKSSKKKKTGFLDLKNFYYKQTYEAPIINNFSNEERKYITRNILNLSKYYQTFNHKTKIFNYFVFPKLIYDNFFFDKIYFNNNLNFPPSNLRSEYISTIKEINQYISIKSIYKGELINIFNYDISQICFEKEIFNYIILTWLNFFSMTFYYCRNEEKYYRFYEMLEIINKTLIYYDNSTISYLFNSIFEYGNEYMTLKLYEIIKNKNYTHFSYLINKLEEKNINEPSQKEVSFINPDLGIKVFKHNEKLQFDEFKKEDKINKRILDFENEKNEGEIIFDKNIICEKCKSKIDIIVFTLIYIQNNKKNYTFNCINCKQEINPKIKVKYNNKIETFNLCSPWYLYNVYSVKLIKENGLKLDLKKFRNENKNIFWNCIWYFGINALSFSIFLEYENKKNHENNKNEIPSFCELKIDNKVIDINYSK